MTRRAPAMAAAALFAACSSTPDPAADPDALDARTLARKTVVEAIDATLVLSERWRDAAQLDGDRLEGATARTTVARGSAVFRLKQLTVRAKHFIEVRWQPAGHADLLLSAHDVTHFEHGSRFRQSSKNIGFLVFANGEVSILP